MGCLRFVCSSRCWLSWEPWCPTPGCDFALWLPAAAVPGRDAPGTLSSLVGLGSKTPSSLGVPGCPQVALLCTGPTSSPGGDIPVVPKVPADPLSLSLLLLVLPRSPPNTEGYLPRYAPGPLGQPSECHGHSCFPQTLRKGRDDCILFRGRGSQDGAV